MTSFASKEAAMTLDFLPGDIAYIPPTYGTTRHRKRCIY